MFLSFDKSRNVWYFFYHDSNGIRRKKSTLTSNKKMAIAFAKQFVPEEKPKESIALTKYQAQYLKEHHRFKEKTIKGYMTTFKFFRNAIGGATPLNQITTKDIKLYLIERATNHSIYQARRDRIHLHAFFGSAVPEYLESNPVALIKAREYKLPEKIPTYFTEEEFEKLENAIEDKKLRDVVVFAVNTGMRQMEIIELRWNQINFRTKLILLHNQNSLTKTNTVRSIPMNQKVLNILQDKQALFEGEYVFTFSGKKMGYKNLHARYKRYITKLGLNPKYNFHTLRHTFASWLVQRGIPILVVSQLLGHRNLKTTQIYAHLAPSNALDAVQVLD